VLPPHVWPSAFFGWQTPARQKAVLAQSISVTQPPLQVVPLQVLGAQLTVFGPGQTVDEPVQVSASVAIPAEQLGARHCVPALPAGCVQALPVPSQRSRVQGFVSAVQAVPATFFESEGQVAELPGQFSA
jgi:hypothetical protein